MLPREIAQMLADNIDAVCRELLPNGKREGAEWKVGSPDGEVGNSMGVRISGEKSGVWCDFATGESGDALELWRVVRGCTIAEAIQQAKGFLGIADVPLQSAGRSARPQQRLVVPARTEQGKAMDYLAARGFSEVSIKALKIKNLAAPHEEQLLFPYLRSAAEQVAFAIKQLNPKSPKSSRFSAGSKPGLFGWQALPEYEREVVLVDGEMDVLAMLDYGVPVLGTPDSEDWIEAEYDNLQRFDTVYVCMKSDETGHARAKKIIDRLGRERCRYMRLPYATAMDCYSEGCPPSVIRQHMQMALAYAPEGLVSGGDLYDVMVNAFYPEEDPEHRKGITLPGGRNSENIVFRPSELVIVNGISGHGKSQALGHVVIDGLSQGHKFLIASMEMNLQQLSERLGAQTTGMDRPSPDYIGAVTEWYTDKLWFYDVRTTVTPDRLFEVMRYAYRRHGVKAFVIDSLMKCGIADDDYRGQKAFVDRICDFKNETESTVFLVTHSKKLMSEKQSPGKFEVLGASGITNLADTGLSVWRRKEDDDLSGENEDYDGPNCSIDVWKQRNGNGWEGKLHYWFDPKSRQYLQSSGARPKSYVQFSKLRAVQ